MSKGRIFNTADQKKFELVYIPERKDPPKPVAEPPVTAKTKTKSKGKLSKKRTPRNTKAEKIPETMKPIYKMSGAYLGFTSNGFLFSRDGDYLGWIDGQYVWDAAGRFRGQLWEGKYIIFNPFRVQPLPKQPRAKPVVPALPNPPPNIPPVAPPTGWVAGF
jgi:hypothetical protein